MIIRMCHIRKAKMCCHGTRSFFYKNNLDWKDFVKNGIEEEMLLKTNDAMAQHVVEIANGG